MAAESRWTAGQHPTPEELLLAHEDQLPREQVEPVVAHIHQCWQCRAHVDRYQRGIDAYLRFRELHHDPAASPQSGGWLRMAARLRDAGSNPEPRPIAFWKRVPRPLWVAFPILAAAIAAAVLFWPAPLTAQVVLARALNAEPVPARNPRVQRVRIRRGGSVIEEDEFMLRRAYVDPAHPLSARSFQTWHDSLHVRHDSVTVVATDIRLETTTPEGAVALARIDLTRADYQPRARHVEMRDGVTIDVDTVEAPHEATAADPTPPAAAPAKTALAPRDREALELDVRLALHAIDADLGEPIEIHPDGASFVVSGTLDDSTRRRQVLSALRGLRRVTTQLTVAAPDADMLAKAQPIEAGAPEGIPLLASQLQHDFPDAAARSAFISRALELARALRQRSWALRRLAERYPIPTENALPADARATLQQLVEAHQSALRTAAAEAASSWKPYIEFASLATGSQPWQTAALTRLPAAQSFDHLTARLLSTSGNDGLALADALRQLRDRYRELNP